MLNLVAFPQNLAEIRQARGLTQQTLANAAHIHVTQLRRYEAGTSQPTLDVLRRLATVARQHDGTTPPSV